MPQFLVVPIYFLVAEVMWTLEFCYPDLRVFTSDKTYSFHYIRLQKISRYCNAFSNW